MAPPLAALRRVSSPMTCRASSSCGRAQGRQEIHGRAQAGAGSSGMPAPPRPLPPPHPHLLLQPRQRFLRLAVQPQDDLLPPLAGQLRQHLRLEAPDHDLCGCGWVGPGRRWVHPGRACCWRPQEARARPPPAPTTVHRQAGHIAPTHRVFEHGVELRQVGGAAVFVKVVVGGLIELGVLQKWEGRQEGG